MLEKNVPLNGGLLGCAWKPGVSSKSLPIVKFFLDTPSSLAPFQAPASLTVISFSRIRKT